MMFRYLALILLFSTPATAQDTAAEASTTVEIAPKDTVKARAEELDRLFAQLQQKAPDNPANLIAKIWTMWERNDSAMAEILLGQSGKAMRDGAFDTSEIMLNELTGAYPDYTEALNTRAKLYYNQKRYDEALTDLNAVLDVEPRHFGALSGKAAVLQAQGKTAEAAEVLRDAILINPHLQAAKDVLKQLEHDYPTL